MWTNLPDRLRFARQQAKLSTAEVGEALGVSASTVARWERGQGAPHGADRAQLADIVRWNYHALFPPAEVLGQLDERDQEMFSRAKPPPGGGKRLRIPARFRADRETIKHLIDAWLIVPNGAEDIYRLTGPGEEVRRLARTHR